MILFYDDYSFIDYSWNWRSTPDVYFILYTKCRAYEVITTYETKLEENEEFTAHVLDAPMVLAEEDLPSLAVFTAKGHTTRRVDEGLNGVVEELLIGLQQAGAQGELESP